MMHHLSENALFPREFGLFALPLMRSAASMDGIHFCLHDRQAQIGPGNDPRGGRGDLRRR